MNEMNDESGLVWLPLKLSDNPDMIAKIEESLGMNLVLGTDDGHDMLAVIREVEYVGPIVRVGVEPLWSTLAPVKS